MSEPVSDEMGREIRDHLERTMRAFVRLVQKLELISVDPQFAAVFLMYKIHGGEYTGPNWAAELLEAQACLREAKAMSVRAEAADPQEGLATPGDTPAVDHGEGTGS